MGRQCSTKQTSKLGEQACAVQLVDCIGKLVADVKHWVFARCQHCNVIHCITKIIIKPPTPKAAVAKRDITASLESSRQERVNEFNTYNPIYLDTT